MLSESPGTPSFLSNAVGSPAPSSSAADPFTSIPTTPVTNNANIANAIFAPSSRPQSEVCARNANTSEFADFCIQRLSTPPATTSNIEVKFTFIGGSLLMALN